MSTTNLTATLRTEFGKGAARRIRRSDKIPAVVYGHQSEPQHITLPGHGTMMALKQQNALLTIDVEGGKELLALVKDIQRDPVRGTIEHVDLVIVRRGEKVIVEVAVQLEGEAAPETFVTLEHTDVSLEVEATNIPDSIVVDIEGLGAGSQITAAELKLPEGAALAMDEDALIVNVAQAISEAALEAELAESPAGEAEAAAAEAAEGEEA